MEKRLLEHLKNTGFALLFVVIFFALIDVMGNGEHSLSLKDSPQIEAQSVTDIKQPYDAKSTKMKELDSSAEDRSVTE